MSAVSVPQAAASGAAASVRSDGERSKRSRRRHRTDEDEDEALLGSRQQQQATHLIGEDSTESAGPNDASRSAAAADQQPALTGGTSQSDTGPARKRRRKSRPHLLGGSIAPGPWTVADLDNSTSSGPDTSYSMKRARSAAGGRNSERSVSNTAAPHVSAAGRSVLGDESNLGRQVLGTAASGRDIAPSESQVDSADAMAVDDIDQKFADMVQEFLRLEAPMKEQHVDFSKIFAPQRPNSEAQASMRAPKERIIPGMGPRPSTSAGKKAASATEPGGQDHPSDWEDEEEGESGQKKKRQEEVGDSSDDDYDREGEDEDSNSEGFYRNDYPEGEGNDDDEGMFFDSEDDGDEDEEAEASDQYGDD